MTGSVGAGCGKTRIVVTTVTVERAAPAATAQPGDLRLYGRIRSLTRKGSRYELRFDPASFLMGVTANAAQAEDQRTPCEPLSCAPVANDNYVVDEGHRALVYIVPASAVGTVLGKGGTNGIVSRRITAAQLAAVVAGRSPLKLYEPLSTGFWILVRMDTVRTFAQQYVP